MDKILQMQTIFNYSMKSAISILNQFNGVNLSKYYN